jgi:hypothetical protein
MNDIYTQSELEQVVGYKSNHRIIKWLKANRIPYLVSGTGKPLVNRAALAYLMGAPIDKPIQSLELDFSNKKGFTSQ